MRTRTIILVAAGLLVPALFLSAQGVAPLLPLMVDLPGWQAEKADGADMSATGTRALVVSRSYENGDRRFEATILYGTQASTSWLPDYKEGYRVEASGSVMEVKKVNGFLVFDMFETEGQSGGIVVLLQETGENQNGSVFAVSYQGLGRDEALKTAQRFSWQKMKAEVGRLK